MEATAMIALQASELRELLAVPDGRPQLVDVRRAEAVARDRCAVPGAVWRDPAQVERWWRELRADRPVVAYCVHGHEVSQQVGDRLRAHGLDARHLEGGLSGWRAAGGGVVLLPEEGDVS
jgi:rhodanese-related sulfurtransferase